MNVVFWTSDLGTMMAALGTQELKTNSTLQKRANRYAIDDSEIWPNLPRGFATIWHWICRYNERNIYSQSWASRRSRRSSRRRTTNWSVVERMSQAWIILCTVSHLYSLQGATEGSCRWRSEVVVVWGSQIGKITFCDAGDASESRLR
jgi:hypothetical protein